MRLCSGCNENFPDTYSLCPECNAELAPSVSQEEVPDVVVLCTVLNEAKAYIMRGFLENEDIPCQLENISFHAEPAPVADLMKVRLWVLREDSERACKLLEERERIQICSVCETETEDVVCPNCGERMGQVR